MRAQLRILKDFIEKFDFVRMKPETSLITSGVPEGATARVLAEANKAYALYLKGGAQASLRLALPAGRYRAEWVNPRTGKTDKTEVLDHPGGEAALVSPSYIEDIALRLVRQ